MRALFPYAWQVDYMLVGGARPASRVYGDLLSVDVPEYSLSDAPEIASWTETDGIPGGRRNRVEVRLVDGEFFAPATDGLTPIDRFGADMLTDRHRVRFAPLAMLFRDIVFETRSPQKIWSLMSELVGGTDGKKADSPPRPDTVDFVIHDDRDRQASMFADVASSLAIIDGAVWKKGHEPTVVMNHDLPPADAVWRGMINTVGLNVNVGTTRYGRRMSTPMIGVSIGLPEVTSVFGLADWEEAVAAHEAFDHPNQDRWTKTRYFEDVEIADRSALSFDPDCDAVARHVEHAVLKFAEDIAVWPRASVERYLGMRQGVETFRTAGDIGSLEEAFATMREIAASQAVINPSVRAVALEACRSLSLDNAGIALDPSPIPRNTP